MKIDGKAIALELLKHLKIRVDKLKEKGIIPHLCIITFGKNPQTESYLKQKILRSEQIGAKITIKKFDEDVNQEIIYDLIGDLNGDKKVNGIIVQRPLPKSFEEFKICKAVKKEKDVDGFYPGSPFDPPVALAVIELIKNTKPNIALNTKKIALVGKGTTAGKPIISFFEKMNIQTIKIDSKTQNANKILKSADIIVSSVGKKIINSSNIKNGVILIGVGMHTENGKLKGDYEETEIEKIAKAYTPTPGGVGPVNVTMLMKNLVEASENQNR